MYNVQLLTDVEFDKLPYKHASNHEVCGLANPQNNTAYVRHNMTAGMRLLTIDHELQELTSKFSEHEEDGIRYGWFKKLTGISTPQFIKQSGNNIGSWAPQVAGTILTAMGMPYIGVPLAGIGSGIHNYQSTGSYGSAAISGVAGGAGAYFGGNALSSGISSFTGASAGNVGGASYLNPWIAGAKGVVGMGGVSSGAARAALINAPGPLTSQFAAGQSALGSQFGGLSGGSNLLGTGTFSTPSLMSLSETFGAQEAGFVAGLGNATNFASAASTVNASSGLMSNVKGLFNLGKGILSNPVSNLGLMQLGGGLMSLSALPINAPVPNIGQITSKWLTADSVTKAGAKAAEMANVAYGSGQYTPAKETLGLISVMQGDINKAYKERAESLDKMASVSNENWLQSGERIETLQKLEEERIGETSNAEKELLSRDQQQWSSEKYSWIMTQLQVDEATKRDLLYGELSEIMTKYQVDEANIMALRNLASQAGLYAFAKGINLFGN